MARGEPSRPRFFSTHPSTPERVQNVEAIARSLVRTPVAQIAGNRAAFLGRLDGLVVGDNAGNGVFAGATFLHPEFDLAIDMPAHWKTANTPEIVGAVAPDERAIVLLQLVGPGDDPVAGARTDGVAESQLGALRRVTISGLPAAQVIATTRDGDRVGLTWIAHRQRVFRVAGLSAGSDWERYRPALDRTASSFRPLSAADRPRIVQSRLRVRPAVAGETVSQVLARGGSSWTPAQAAVANAVAVDTKLDPGWPVKVAISERYAATLSGRVP
jgi:predicted Zn-dependent protease